jgi:hypothetical protein
MGRRNDWEGEWHHRAPDYKLVYCGPKESHKEEKIKIYNRNRLDKTSVTNTIDAPEMDIKLNSKRKRLKLSTKT